MSVAKGLWDRVRRRLAGRSWVQGGRGEGPKGRKDGGATRQSPEEILFRMKFGKR